MIKPIAVFVTLTAAGMTALAAWDRGGTLLDRLLLVSMAVVIVLAVHLLPALSRRPAAWLVWAGCLLCAVYGHLTFLTHANLRAGDLRASQSSLSAATERQIDLVQASLSHIQARPVATVAAELAASKSWRDRAALKVEIAQGKRGEQLRDELGRLSQLATTALVTEAADPVAARLGVVTGWSESAVTVVIGLTFSILIELVGALLWFEALRLPVTPASPSQPAKEQDITEEITAVTDDITRVTAAINSGECKPTVGGIRVFMACSQTRAMELRQRYLEGG
ncbi:MAG: hypothetical protein B7Y56_03290 [Gallionellales bacterium 35-53-114]|jgi:hypothetical protein|nr:MAG: hypothetical protein B7Y56_03290 [Gallionellales bacterium 35-53-114]OYZ65129.1 MAG: hypothetical protein B7Y04_00450 [Gallionellales bacterium 24-53-125]OZB08037.1 MAG: hypothetical protein B7X61_10900 [Gallionellales bacterium 39-52-133]HQS59940.1 hypothetical protein [Gallionellaceae bacterium]HQS76678.1 hypothetical protein [Gallionellaceae bacterium]